MTWLSFFLIAAVVSATFCPKSRCYYDYTEGQYPCTPNPVCLSSTQYQSSSSCSSGCGPGAQGCAAKTRSDTCSWTEYDYYQCVDYNRDFYYGSSSSYWYDCVERETYKKTQSRTCYECQCQPTHWKNVKFCSECECPACSIHGSCSKPCNCVSGYQGQCQCTCDSTMEKGFWTGHTCSSCQNRFGISSECKQCVSTAWRDGASSCSCHSNLEDGMWDGSKCERCQPGYAQNTGCTDCVSNARPVPTAPTTTRTDYFGIDVQIESQTCECNRDLTRGYWAGTYCDACVDRFDIGNQCRSCIRNAELRTGASEDYNSCVCSQDSVNGWWKGSQCDSCKNDMLTLSSGCTKCVENASPDERGECECNGGYFEVGGTKCRSHWSWGAPILVIAILGCGFCYYRNDGESPFSSI